MNIRNNVNEHLKENRTIEITKESIEKQLRDNQNKMQNEFASKVLEDIKWWNEKANRKDYKPTIEEQAMFVEIVQIVNGMNQTGLLNCED